MRIFFLLFVFLGFTTLPAAADTVCALYANDLPGLEITRASTYDGNSLWGYIDGGADLYLEYGFDALLVQEVAVAGNTFRVDIYKMKTPEAAYGIYSVMHFKPDATDSLPGWNCASRHQVQFPRGLYYVSVINDNADKEVQLIGIQIAQLLWERTGGKSLVFPDVFNAPVLTPFHKSVKFMNGKLGIQNGYASFESLFEEFSGYSLFVMPVRDSILNGEIALIRFVKPESKAAFCKKLGCKVSNELQRVEDKHGVRVIKQTGAGELLFFESSVLGAGVEKIIEMLKQQK